jgi:hypothetical protein
MVLFLRFLSLKAFKFILAIAWFPRRCSAWIQTRSVLWLEVLAFAVMSHKGQKLLTRCIRHRINTNDIMMRSKNLSLTEKNWICAGAWKFTSGQKHCNSHSNFSNVLWWNRCKFWGSLYLSHPTSTTKSNCCALSLTEGLHANKKIEIPSAQSQEISSPNLWVVN